MTEFETRLKGMLADHADRLEIERPPLAELPMGEARRDQRSGPGRRASMALAAASVVLVAGVAALIAVAAPDEAPVDPSTDTPTTEPEPSLHPVGGEWRYRFEWASPQDYYEASYDLWQAATQACMSAAGFDYVPVAYWDSDAIYAQLNPLNEAVAAEFGYSSPPSGLPDDPNRGDDAFNAALVDRDGCSNVALNYAYGGPASADLADRFGSLFPDVERSIAGFEETATGRELLAEWNQCMTVAGFDYETPADARDDVLQGSGVLRGEQRVRLADLECDRSVGLTAGRSDFEQEAIDDWADRNASEIAELEASLEAAKAEVADRQHALDERGPEALEGVEPLAD